jgi:conjugative transfer signal peptidase TraF
MGNMIMSRAMDAGILKLGSCENGMQPLLKTVAAIPGDIVTVGNDGIAVNCKPIDNTGRIRFDHDGIPIPMIDEGVFLVERGRVWLISNYHKRSYDSRYFGAVSVNDIVGMAVPVLTE